MRKHLKAWPRHSLTLSLLHSVCPEICVKLSEPIKWASVCVSMVSYGIQWYPMVHNGTQWQPMTPYGTLWYQMVPNGAEWCQIVLNGTEWCRMLTYVTK